MISLKHICDMMIHTSSNNNTVHISLIFSTQKKNMKSNLAKANDKLWADLGQTTLLDRSKEVPLNIDKTISNRILLHYMMHDVTAKHPLSFGREQVLNMRIIPAAWVIKGQKNYTVFPFLGKELYEDNQRILLAVQKQQTSHLIK